MPFYVSIKHNIDDAVKLQWVTHNASNVINSTYDLAHKYRYKKTRLLYFLIRHDSEYQFISTLDNVNKCDTKFQVNN